MGSSTSKDAAGATAPGPSAPSSSGGVAKRCRSIRSRCFGSACLGMPHVCSDDKRHEEIGALNDKVCTRVTGTSLTNAQHNSEEEIKIPQPIPQSIPNSSIRPYDRLLDASHTDLNRRITGSDIDIAPPSVDFRSRLDLFRDRAGFRVARPAHLGSSDSRPILSRSYSIPYTTVGASVHDDSEGSIDVSCELLQDTATSTAPTALADDSTTNTDDTDTELHRTGVDGHVFNNLGVRRPRRAQEPLEGTARFSRTLSVGRLRDRVLRRTPVAEGRIAFGSTEDRHLHFLRQASGRQFLSGTGNILSSVNDNSDDPFSNASASIFSRFPGTAETTRSLATRNTLLRVTSSRDTLEQRSTFIESRRRIRSQVRALQRLGNRFENLSGHNRSCILSGHHRTGRCSCRTNSRAANSSDETGTRASISRIVMLAEALFEVLDEIHHQAVVLSSRPSLSSIGSVPAPKEVVDCMPVKIYTKSPKHQSDEAAQCYICLVEYEEGDHLRILPCHHEYHQSCIDKWLKEIHRVCPLCRGDVCINDVSHTEAG